MKQNKTLANQILQFNEALSLTTMELPTGFRLINPYNGDQKN
ncbi:hypothetical protein LIIV107777_07960 [Listeria ivanovii subsp. ivanovii]